MGLALLIVVLVGWSNRPLAVAAAVPARGAWVVTPAQAAWAPAATTPAEALKAVGIIAPNDGEITVNGHRWQAGQALPQGKMPPVVQFRQPVRVTLKKGGQIVHLNTTAPTLGIALWEQGIVLTEADRLRPGALTLLAKPLQATLTPARPLDVRVGERALSLHSTATTVGEALAEIHLAPQGLEFTTPADTAPLPTSSKTPVALHRVEETVLLRQLPVAFTTKTQPLPNEPLDTIKVVQEGAYGLQVQRVRVRYQDGVEVARTVEDAWLAQPPKPRIVGYGTKIVSQTLQTSEGVVTCWRVVRVYATSYSPCRLGVDRCSDRTFSGMTLRKGIVAVKRSWYAYMGGQKVYVPGYGFGVIADIGGGIPGRPWIDLGYSDDDYQSWHQWTTLCFVAPPPPPEQIPWILP